MVQIQVIHKLPKQSPFSLTALIKSLDKSEKRYLRLTILANSPVFEKIFDSIEAFSPDHDGNLYEHVKESVKNEATLRVMKRFLYEAILNSMRNLPSLDNEVYKDITGRILDIRFLIEKGLHDQAKIELAKAKSMIYKFDRHIDLPEILRLEYILLKHEQDLPNIRDNANSVLNELNKALEQIDNIFQYYHSDLWFQYPMMRSTTTRAKEEKAINITFREIMEKSLFKDESKAKSMEARIIFHNLNLFYKEKQSEEKGIPWSKLLQENKSFIDLLESEKNKHFIQALPERYVALLNNHMRLASGADNLTEYKKTIEKLKISAFKATRLQIVKRAVYFKAVLSMCYTEGIFQDGIAVAKDCTKFLKRFQGRLNLEDQVTLHALVGREYLVTRKFNEAKKHNDIIIKMANTLHDLRLDLQCDARIENLLILYEMGNLKKLQPAVREAEKFLLSMGETHTAEQLLINFFKVIPQINPGQRKIFFQNKLSELEALQQSKLDSNILTYFDYISWFKSKISGKPFQVEYKERLKPS